MKNEKLKKCKNEQKILKNDIKNALCSENFAQNEKIDCNQIYYLAWIKTLLWARRILPNIVSVIDKLILKYASSPSMGSNIFDDRLSGTFAQVDEIIKFEERKVGLINLKIMIEKMVESLPKKYREYVELKYFQNKKYPLVATELGIDERTCYRWNKIILIKLMKFCKASNWSLSFVTSQVADEKWLMPHFQKNLKLIKKSFSA